MILFLPLFLSLSRVFSVVLSYPPLPPLPPLPPSSRLIAFISPSTPPPLLCSLTHLRQTSIHQITVLSAADIDPNDSLPFADYYLDAVFSEKLSFITRKRLEANSLVVNANSYDIDGEISLFARKETEIGVIIELLKRIKVTKLCLFLSAEMFAVKERYYVGLPGVEIIDFALPLSLDFESLKLLIRKEIKTKNFAYFLFDTSADESSRILAALLEGNMAKNPSTMLFTQRAAQFRSARTYQNFTKSGFVFTAETACEGAVTECELVACKVESVLNGRGFDGGFSIVNLQNDTEVVVGWGGGGVVSLCEECVYLRAEGGPVDALRTAIQFSFNNATMNPGGDTNGGEKEFYWGADLAVMDVNNSTDILPGFKFQVFNVTFGMNQFNETWAMKNMKGVSESDMGVAFLHGHYSNVAIPAYNFISHKLNYSLPQVGCDNTSPLFTSTKTYPAYTRITMSNTYLSVLYTNTLKRYGWKRVAVLHCDDLFCMGLYNGIVENTLKAGITIVNDESTRKLPASMSEYPTSLVPVLRAIVESKVKIFMLILYGNTLFYTLDVLYDIGVRRDDFEFLSIDWLNPTLFTLGSDDALMHRKELLHGTLQFYPTAFAGAFGEYVETHFKQVFGKDASHFACNNYDGVLMIAHAIDYMIQTGEDYENPIALGKALKQTRFVGCTGEVQIEEGTNDRAPMTFQILNAYIAEDGTAIIRNIGTYNPTGLLLFNFTAPVIWPDNTTNTPVDTRISTIDCPFDQKNIVIYWPGMFLAYAMLVLMSVISIVITVVIWRNTWNVSAPALENRHEISFDDYVQFATIGIEALQYAAMGPDFSTWSSALSQVSASFSWKLDEIFNLKHGTFWVVMDVTLGLIAVWSLLLMVIRFDLRRKWECVCSNVGDIGEKLLPILGNLCFLPISSMILNVFLCGQATNSEESVGLTQSFLKQDCYQRCWTKPHLFYVAASIVGFVVYTPVAVYLRPTWQNSQISLHIHASPAYLMVKTIYQMAIIAGNKVLKDTNALSHAIIFDITAVGFLLFTMKWRPYGYGRANLWHFVSLACLLWLELLNFITMMASGGLFWLGVFAAGLGFIILVGFLIQWRKVPSYLYRPKGLDVVDLFRFQFSRGGKWLYMFKKRGVEPVTGETNRRLEDSSRHEPIIPTFGFSSAIASQFGSHN